jgi:signal transduction histidine kinase/ActR/RegA family two-component response regulator
MNSEISFFNFSVSKITSKDELSLDNGRIRLLYYGLVLAIYVLCVLQVNLYYKHLPMLSATNGVMLLSAIILFKALTYRPNWKAIAHIALIIGTLVNLVDVLVILQSFGNVGIGAIIIIVLFSFYMFGQKWGAFYSLLNLIPVIAFVVLQYNGIYFINITPEKTGQLTFIISMIASFGIGVYINSHFYSVISKSSELLKETNEKQTALNQKYEQAIGKVEKSYEARSEFLSTMSHEIRTPLNAVIGMSNLLLMNEPRPDQKENLEVLKFSAANLLSIVNDVLDFNTIESGKQVFENTKMNIAELMQNICGGQALQAQEKGLGFDLEVDKVLHKKEVYGDPTRITQVVFNLISNAIKFTHDGTIHVKVTCVEDRHNMVAVNFAVKDTGIGIVQDKLDLIFEPFTQESLSTTRQYGGTGLGLAIVKRLLESQGVKIQVASRPGIGSEFSFNMDFPVHTEKQQATLNGSHQPDENNTLVEADNNLRALRVLIAEDNPVNVMLMKKLLSKWEISPTIAENGEHAVNLMHRSNFDIILMDLQMPLMNGFDAAMQIRKMSDPKKSTVPIIALTASALADIKEKVYAAGMNEYISKPFKPSELLEKMQQLTSTSSAYSPSQSSPSSSGSTAAVA